MNIIKLLLILTFISVLAEVKDANAQTTTYSIGGSVNGLAVGKTVVLKNNANTLLVPSSTSSFAFPAQNAGTSWNVTVAIQPSGQTCAVSNASGSNISANITNVVVTCVNTYTVGGTVSGLTGASLVLRMGTASLIISGGTTTFKFASGLKTGATYTVLAGIQPAGYACSVSNGSGIIASTNVTNIGVTCVRTYTISGAVSGLTTSGLVLKLTYSCITGSCVATKIVSSGATSFAFFTGLKTGDTYAVTVQTQPTGQTCMVMNGSATIAVSNITDVNVICALTYAVSGIIQGLNSSAFVLSLNGSTLTVQNGTTTFAFPTYLTSGQAYSVAVATQPAGQNCSVTNGSGIVASSNINNILVFCQNTFRIEVWVDNWFSVNVLDSYGRTFNAEDSVAYQTIKSFNADSFNFKANYPFDLNFVIKDYIQMDYLNGDTGLEYINNVGGTQQVGDGGFIMQVTDTASNRVVAVSDNKLRCLVTHHAPANPTSTRCLSSNPTTASNSCGLPTKVAEPSNWTQIGFDTSSWISPIYYTAQQVGVKPDYYTIAWDASAKLIWSSDLKLDNWLLCKVTVSAPQ